MAKIGDLVTVKECRPFSKSKTWKLLSENPVTQTTEVETEGDHS